MLPSLTYDIVDKTLHLLLLCNSEIVLVSLYEVLSVPREKRLWINHLFMSPHPCLSHNLQASFMRTFSFYSWDVLEKVTGQYKSLPKLLFVLQDAFSVENSFPRICFWWQEYQVWNWAGLQLQSWRIARNPHNKIPIRSHLTVMSCSLLSFHGTKSQVNIVFCTPPKK